MLGRMTLISRPATPVPGVILLYLLACLSIRETTAADSGIRWPDGFSASVIAETPVLGNAVAIDLDEQGNLWTVEANRRGSGTPGITSSRWWSMEDYQGRTLADRAAMYDRWAHVVPEGILTREADVLRRLRLEGGGITTSGSDILTSMRDRLDGNAAGVLALEDRILVANVPSLWSVDPSTGERTALLTGFGVRVGVYGHDLHGLTLGPDGRVYFTMGDRGFDVDGGPGRKFSEPKRGGFFRCFPDGSGLELLHVGLRNVQEPGFNELGDWFAVDNDMGGVDRCRVLYLWEGGDAGWDATYQLTRNFREETERPDDPEPIWFTEALWEKPHNGQPAWVNPPLEHLTRGPCGLLFLDSAFLPESLRQTFLIADFAGTATRSGIHQFQVVPDGAGYRMGSTNLFAWGVLPTDMTLDPEGRLYVIDWKNGWGGVGDRRLWRIQSTSSITPSFRSVDASKSPGEIWQSQLDAPDQPTRLKAQHRLAKGGSQEEKWLAAALTQSKTRYGRLHGLWGLWERGLRNGLEDASIRVLVRTSTDPDPVLRARTLGVIGELGLSLPLTAWREAILDPKPRVRVEAARAMARLGIPQGMAWILESARRHKPQATERRMLASSLARGWASGVWPEPPLKPEASQEAREILLLALRQSANPGLSAFLEDPDPSLAWEAIRALHDLPVPGGIPLLADAFQDLAGPMATAPLPIRHRLLNALFRRGGSQDAVRLQALANQQDFDSVLRVEALRMLDHWENPSPFDRVTWNHRPHALDRESPKPSLLARNLAQWLRDENVRQLPGAEPILTRLAARWLPTNPTLLGEVLFDSQVPEAWRSALANQAARTGSLKTDLALRWLQEGPAGGQTLVAARLAREGNKEGLRWMQAAWKQAGQKPSTALLEAARQMPGPWNEAVLESLASALSSVSPIPTWALDWILAAQASSSTQLQSLAQRTLDGAPTSEGRFRWALSGGDPARGAQLFRNHAVQCIRCHRVQGYGGEAGPDLSKVGKELDRKGLVTALVEPSARIAPGFGLHEMELRNGMEIAGFLQSEKDGILSLRTQDGREIQVAAEDIAQRRDPVSAMPPMAELLTLEEIRDLTAWLEKLK